MAREAGLMMEVRGALTAPRYDTLGAHCGDGVITGRGCACALDPPARVGGAFPCAAQGLLARAGSAGPRPGRPAALPRKAGPGPHVVVSLRDTTRAGRYGPPGHACSNATFRRR